MLRIARALSTTLLALSAALPASAQPEPIAYSCPGLTADLDIARGDLHIPIINAPTLNDAYAGQGFTHAQDRFLQMDLMRRATAGTLAELLGPDYAIQDELTRAKLYQPLADNILTTLPERHREALRIYAQGVNTALLHFPPAEYALLGLTPEPWQERDTLLVAFVMFESLATDFGEEPLRARVRDLVTPDVEQFLAPLVADDDAPMIVDPNDTPAPIPTFNPDTAANLTTPIEPAKRIEPGGSNNWAVAANRSATDAAMLASDMHLPITLPGIWHRTQLQWGGGGWNDGTPIIATPSTTQGQAVGISLPGVPGIIAGSNGAVAWGMTNAMADVMDRVAIIEDPDNPDHYLTPQGPLPFAQHTHTINIRGKDPITRTSRSTIFGPVADDALGLSAAVRWTGYQPNCIDIDILDMLTAHTAGDAFNIAARWLGPPQNVVVADRAGKVGWVVSGYIPTRDGFDPSVPTKSTDPGAWTGNLPLELRPHLKPGATDMVWSANNRTASAKISSRVGRIYAGPARANRIKAMLDADDSLTELEMLAMQLDVRCAFLDPYANLLLQTAQQGDDPRFARVADLVNNWNGAATTDSAAHRIITWFRGRIRAQILAQVVAQASGSTISVPSLRDQPVLTILAERPDNLIPLNHTSWDNYFAATLSSLLDQLERNPNPDLAAPWGEFNRLDVESPIASLLPAGMAKAFRLPSDPLPGEWETVRVSTPNYGASNRLVVSPGYEGSAILHIPGGQQGWPLLPHAKDMHADWVQGNPTPLLAQNPTHSAILTPVTTETSTKP